MKSILLFTFRQIFVAQAKTLIKPLLQSISYRKLCHRRAPPDAETGGSSDISPHCCHGDNASNMLEVTEAIEAEEDDGDATDTDESLKSAALSVQKMDETRQKRALSENGSAHRVVFSSSIVSILLRAPSGGSGSSHTSASSMELSVIKKKTSSFKERMRRGRQNGGGGGEGGKPAVTKSVSDPAFVVKGKRKKAVGGCRRCSREEKERNL